MEKTLEFIPTMGADLGGTEIYEPLDYAITTLATEHGKQTRIFLLTDGDVSNA